MTRTLVDVAKPLGITIHDHLIVGRKGHTSFRERRLL
jgi:DNA repair protein RadC